MNTASPRDAIAAALAAVGDGSQIASYRVDRDAGDDIRIGFNEEPERLGPISSGWTPIFLKQHLGTQSIGWARAVLALPAAPALAGFEFHFDPPILGADAAIQPETAGPASLGRLAASAVAAASSAAADRPKADDLILVEHHGFRREGRWAATRRLGWVSAVTSSVWLTQEKTDDEEGARWCRASDAWLSGVAAARLRFVLPAPTAHGRAAAARTLGFPLSFALRRLLRE